MSVRLSDAAYEEIDPSSEEIDALLRSEDIGRLDARPEHLKLKRSVKLRAFIVRALALLCACSLSIGSHYGSYILSPLKSRLSREMGTSNTEFSLLISAFSLNSTWTPLVGGYMASRLGTTFTSILATGVILTGLSTLLIGDVAEDVRLMTLGMFIFGLGVSPLAVIQETIIVRFFKSHGLGLSMALGLVAGKASSFISARTSYPLSERFGPHAPFYAAATLALVSFTINIVYVSASKWLVHGAGAELEAPELQEEARHLQDVSEAEALKHVAQKKQVKFSEIAELGDVFWAYIAVNVLCGALWHPFAQLAPNVIEHRFQLPEQEASQQASYLLAGSIFLYPSVGLLIDKYKRPYLVLIMFTLSSLLTFSAFAWLCLPAGFTKTAWPAIVTFGAGFGFSPLLLVLLVPTLVPTKYISTTLGAHKSLEQAGTVMSQTLAGLVLDVQKHGHDTETPSRPPPTIDDSRYLHLLTSFLVANSVQLLGIFGLWYLDRRQRRNGTRHRRSLLGSRAEASSAMKPDGDEDEEEEEEDSLQMSPHVGPSLTVEGSYGTSGSPRESSATPNRVSERSKRGRVFAAMCLALVITAWVLFIGTAWKRLRSKADRGGDSED
ncbi:MFS general substrate transporter [Auriscalpium vulgare]|uniref:MFS general substrate transporter n=1 Tax=Auriscalpium vulgare TaxID=40419 RepID=A0ACB8RH26_9AGAM|nr:MFS general substrate transporter [Auriscalpium vulgare]